MSSVLYTELRELINAGESIEEAIESSTTTEIKSVFTEQDSDGNGIGHWVVDSDNSELVAEVLHIAISYGILVELLSLQDNSGNTALLSALFDNKLNALKTIVTAIFNNNRALHKVLALQNKYDAQPLIKIVADNNRETLSHMTQQAKSTNSFDDFMLFKGQGDKTILHQAAAEARVEMVQDLTKEMSGSTPQGQKQILLAQDNADNSALHLGVDSNNAAVVTTLMTTGEKVEGLLKAMLLLPDDSGNTPLNSGLFDEKEEATKAIFTKILENGDLLVAVLSKPNIYNASPFEKIISLDDVGMFKAATKQSTVHGVAKQLLSFTNAAGQTLEQMAKANNAQKIQAYIISSKEAANVQSFSKEVLKVLESGIAKKAQSDDSSANKAAPKLAPNNVGADAQHIQSLQEQADRAYTEFMQAQNQADKYVPNSPRHTPVKTRFDNVAARKKQAYEYAKKELEDAQPKNVGANVQHIQTLQEMADKTHAEYLAAQIKVDSYHSQIPANASPGRKGHLTRLENTAAKAKELDDKAQTALKQAQEQGTIQNPNLALTAIGITKLPDALADLNWAVSKLGFDFAEKTGLQSVSNLKPLAVTGAGLVASAVLQSPALLGTTVFQSKWVQDAIEEICGTGCVAPANVLFTTGLVFAGVSMGAISLPVATGFVALQGANYALNYVDEDSSLILAKPAVQLVSHAANIAVSPHAILKFFDALHMVRSMADSYGENSEQYNKLFENLQQAKNELSPADAKLITATLNTEANTSEKANGFSYSDSSEANVVLPNGACEDNHPLKNGFTHYDFQTIQTA